MKRKLLSILMISSGLLAFGQTNRTSHSSPASVNNASPQSASRQAFHGLQSPQVLGACDTLNFPLNPAWTLSNYTTGTAGAGGFVSGPNTFLDKEKAMYFDASTSTFTKMIGCWIAFDHAFTTVPSKIVPIKVYSNDGAGGSPGTLLGTQNLTMAQIMASTGFTEILFTTPVTLPASKKFYVSVDISNLTWGASAPHDSLSIISNVDGETSPTAAWEKQSDNLWYRYDDINVGWGLDISTLIHPFLTSTLKTPIVFTENATTVCAGGTLNFDATASMPYTLVGWNFGAGNTPDFMTSIGTTPTITGTFNTAGTYPIWLHTLSGGCDQEDSAQVSITVNALPTINSTPATPAFCAGGSTTLSASGGNTYTWAPATGLSATTGSTTVANPTNTITYTITGTSLANCSNTHAVTVTVNQLPTVTANASVPAVCAGSQLTLTGGGAGTGGTYSWTGGATNALAFAPAGTATYTVTGTDANNCSNTANVNVPVNALPVITASSSASAAVCPGTGVTLTGGGAGAGGSYTWTGGVTDAVSFVPSATTTYTVTGTDANNCGGTAMATVTVNTVTTPTATATGTALSSTSSASYQWLFNGSPISGATAQTYTATQTGNYSVIATDANGCSDTSAVQAVTVIGLKSISAAASINVYPNPSKGTFNVAVALDKNSDYTIELRNVLGQTVFTENVNNTAEFKKSFDMTEKAGLYFVIVKDNGGKSSVHKVIVE